MNRLAAPPVADAQARTIAELRACAVSLAEAAAIFRSAQQQTWTLADLHKRYHGYPHPRLVALLGAYFGYVPGRGKRPLFSLDQVLRLDALVRAEVAP